MTPTKAKMAAVLCGLSMAGAGILSGGMHVLDATHVSAAAVQAQASPTAGTSTGAQSQTAPASVQPKITWEKALEIARAQAQGDVREIELETDNGVLTYKVKLGSAKVYINAEDGSVLQVKTKDSTESFPTAKITVEKAIEIAKGQAQGDFKEAQLELDGGSVVWQVEIGDSEVVINAEDGKVLQVKANQGDHEDEDSNDSDQADENDNDSGQADENGKDSGTPDESQNDSASTAGGLYTIVNR